MLFSLYFLPSSFQYLVSKYLNFKPKSIGVHYQERLQKYCICVVNSITELEAQLMLTNPRDAFSGDVVLETRVLVSRRLEDKNESLGLGLGS